MNNNMIAVEELQSLLSKQEPVFVLDIRPEEQYEEWQIPESSHADIYEKLNEGNLAALEGLDIPKNIPVVMVCAAGKTSLIAAEALRKKGYDAYSLEGGMKAWNFAWNTAEIKLPDSDVRIIQVRRSAKGCLSYIIGSGAEAIVVDASLDPGVYIDIAQKHNWKIKYAMDTHVHADYLSRTKELAAAAMAELIFFDGANVSYPFIPVNDHQEIAFGNTNFRVIHTPGHTWESVSYLVDNKALLTGDTLFTDGVGRPDLKADKEEGIKKASVLFDSLQRIMTLPEDTFILPAHISQAVPFDGIMIKEYLGQLKDKIKLLQLSKEQFVESSLKRIPPTPANYLTIAELNRHGNFDGYQPADLEAGANRCAVA
jgi:glyoxylase-like metal-dependent hydrolase (beta-lactamase superfamily II)/rhodanese-related sulfurtransferase